MIREFASQAVVEAVDLMDRIPMEQPAHDKNLFIEPSYPDVDFEELKVEINPEQEDYIDGRNPFVVLMELGKPWIAVGKSMGHDVTAEDLVQATQYRTGASLNEPGLVALHGLARDTITRPVIPEPRKIPKIPPDTEPIGNHNGTEVIEIKKEKKVIKLGQQVLGELQVAKPPQESDKE